MTNETADALKQFVRTSNAVLKVLLYLIEDLKPIIGTKEAQRLVNIIGDAQKGESEEGTCPCIDCKPTDIEKECLNCSKWNDWKDDI